MFEKFKEFIGIDDNYDDDEDYYDDYPKSEDESKSTVKENYTNLLDDSDYIDNKDKSLTYESDYSDSNTFDSSYNYTSSSSFSNLDSSYKNNDYALSNNYKRSSKRGDSIGKMNDNSFANRSAMRISIHEPLDYEKDAPSVIDDILDKKVVVLNLEMVDSDMRRRIFDFVSGAVYALEGTVEKVTKGIFVISPKGVEVNSAITDQISEGNYNQL